MQYSHLTSVQGAGVALLAAIHAGAVHRCATVALPLCRRLRLLVPRSYMLWVPLLSLRAMLWRGPVPFVSIFFAIPSRRCCC
jgi:hypothetical protein